MIFYQVFYDMNQDERNKIGIHQILKEKLHLRFSWHKYLSIVIFIFAFYLCLDFFQLYFLEP